MGTTIFLIVVIALLSFVLLIVWHFYKEEHKTSQYFASEAIKHLCELKRINENFRDHIKIRNKYLEDLERRPYDMDKFMEYNVFISKYSPYQTDAFNEEHKEYLKKIKSYEEDYLNE